MYMYSPAAADASAIRRRRSTPSLHRINSTGGTGVGVGGTRGGDCSIQGAGGIYIYSVQFGGIGVRERKPFALLLIHSTERGEEKARKNR